MHFLNVVASPLPITHTKKVELGDLTHLAMTTSALFANEAATLSRTGANFLQCAHHGA